MNIRKCPICKKETTEIIENAFSFLEVDEIIVIQKDHPSWSLDKTMCATCIDHYKLLILNN